MQHQQLADGKWHELSLVEQLANIGSEVGRAAKWQGKDTASYEAAWKRALELLDLTMEDTRWRSRLKEISRVREFFAGAIFQKNHYSMSLHDLDRYFLQFAFAARLKK